MSGSTIGGAIGAVVGFYVGGPQGAQWGWMIGSAVGGYVDPTQIEGPRLQDARTQTSRDGIAIPFGWGTFPLAGNVIAQGPVVEHKKKERQGKGGPEVTTYSYTRTYAIGLCEGPITGLLQVKRNGKVVYDARTDVTLDEELERAGTVDALIRQKGIAAIRAANAAFVNKATIYLGDETQMPDPALEAIFGAGNVPAHRGLAYFVVEDDDVTDLAGAIPQYEVVVAGAADTTLGADASAYWSLSDRDSGIAGVSLSGSNRDVESYNGTVGEGNSYVGVRAQRARSSGRYYFEIELVRLIKDIEMGVSKVGTELGATAFDGYVSAGVGNPTQFRVGSYSSSHGNPISDGDVIGVGVDLNTHKVWFTINGVELDNGIGGVLSDWSDPAGTHGETLEDGAWAPWVRLTTGSGEVEADGSMARLRVKASELQYLNSAPGDYVPFLPWGICEGVAVPDAPGWFIDENGLMCGGVADTLSPTSVLLSTIVANVCERRGIVEDERDVSQLTDLVTGFVVARETDAASIIQSLAPAYFFDPGEWDAKLRFIKRGGTAVGSINGDDLVEREGDAFERERVQEAELLRRVTVGYNDPRAAYSLTTQKWERRAGTVQALGEASVELPLTLDADDAATIAKRRGLVAWGEPEKQKFSLPYRLSKYTPTDVLNFTDDDGQVYPIRLMDLQDDSGIRHVESSANSAEAYGATATGVVPRPPSITEPSLRGPTNLAVMDLPLWRNSDTDTLGVYVAGCGYLGGWQGAQVDVSTDGGTSYTEAAQITVPATIGATTTALAAWVSSEYPSEQSVTVTLPDAPESVSYEALLRYNNRAALQLDDGSWEILQYQAVVANGNDSYTLSGLVRGRYATTPGAAASGAKFVLLDAAVQFVAVERHLLGDTFKVRATTYGTSSDAAVASDFAFTAGASQTEWPVHGATATRDVSDNVTVSWIGRARLGTETAPYHSTNFAGYRVTYSDGQSFDVAANVTTHTRSSAPASQTITVRPLNAITGAGPASTGITV